MAFLLTSRWVGFRLDMLVGVIMTVAPLLMMALHTKVGASQHVCGLLLFAPPPRGVGWFWSLGDAETEPPPPCPRSCRRGWWGSR